MKALFILTAIIIFSVFLWQEINWLTLVIMPIFMIFVVASITPMMMEEIEQVNIPG